MSTAAEGQKSGFRDRLMSLLDWVAEHDPVTAARLVAEWGEEVARELASGATASDDDCCGAGC